MTLKQFQKLKKVIDKIEEEALNKGIDITLPDFQLIIEKLLKQKGFTLAEYQKAEEQYEEKAIPKGVSAFKGPRGDRGGKFVGKFNDVKDLPKTDIEGDMAYVEKTGEIWYT